MKHTTSFTIFITTTLCTLTSSALATNGVAAIWGTDYYGQATVPNWLGACSQISAGTTHTLAVDATGLVKAWGNNYYGQCTVPYFQYPIVQIAAGDGHSMALQSQIPTQSTTNVKCWGNNSFGQCTIPTSLGNTAKIAAGFYHSLAIKNNGDVVAWGDNRWNQSSVPTSQTGAPLLGSCIQIACGFAHSLAIQSDGTVKAWGAGTTNTGINPELGQSMVPTNLGACTQVAAGGLFSVALKANGTVVTWGNTWASVPTNLGACTAIAAGNSHAVAIQSTGNIVAWGDNTYGQCNVVNHGSALRISASSYNTAAIQTDPCDVDGNGTPNADEPGPSTTSWLFPTITSTFEIPTNWSAGIPGYNTDAKITGNPQITFGCDNSVKTLELSTSSSNWYPGMSLNLNSHNLTVYGGRIAFAPGAGSYVPYSVNINSGFIYTSPTGGFPLRFESDHATWNINSTNLYSYSTELATIGSSQIDVKLNNSTLFTAAISKGDATGGSRHIELLNSSIQDFQGGLTFGDGIWLSLGSIMAGENDYAQNSIVSYGVSGAVFQPGSLLDAWGNLSFVGSASFGGQLDLHTFPSAYHGRSKITVQGQSFNYGAGSSASAFAVMNVYGDNFNQPTCSPPECADEGLITLQLNYNGLASIGGPLFIHNTDNSIPAEGNLYTLISMDPTYQGAFDPNNNKFSAVRWVGQPLQNGLTFEQVLSSDKLQLQCVRAPNVEPAPTNTTNLASVPFASSSADFTNDGRDDVVNLIVGSSNSVQIMKDMGDGTFTQLRTFALPAGATPNAIAAGNVVDDNAPEIAVTSIVSGAGFLTLYNATGTVLWTRAMDAGELPTCVCILAPTVTGGLLGKVAVGTQKSAGTNSNFSTLLFSGAVKTVSGDNLTSQTTPINSVPRTVHSSDIDDDDLGDVTAAGSTSAESFDLAPLGFIQVVKMTTNYPQALAPQYLDFVPVSIATGDIDGDGVKDIFAACNAIPSSIPASTRPVACFLRGTVSPASGLFAMSPPTGISVGLPVQGKAVALVKRNGGFSLAVASTDGVNDSVDVIELNAFSNGSLSIGNQTQISTGGNVIGLRTLKDLTTQKFATIRSITGFASSAVIESTGYVELVYGDFDGSGTVDSGDMAYLLLSFGEAGITDLDGSGITDSGDMALLLLLFS